MNALILAVVDAWLNGADNPSQIWTMFNHRYSDYPNIGDKHDVHAFVLDEANTLIREQMQQQPAPLGHLLHEVSL